MLDLLAKYMQQLPELLKDEASWNSILINYETPNVYRLWRQIDADHRLMLHRIMPCDTPYMHQHPWPSAIHVLDGVYRMKVGSFDEVYSMIPVATIMLTAGTQYEMTDYAGMHSVQPIGGPSHSVMLIGKPWNPIYKPTKQVPNPLDDNTRKELFEKFRSLL